MMDYKICDMVDFIISSLFIRLDNFIKDIHLSKESYLYLTTFHDMVDGEMVVDDDDHEIIRIKTKMKPLSIN